jgi:hypothetical protein
MNDEENKSIIFFLDEIKWWNLKILEICKNVINSVVDGMLDSSYFNLYSELVQQC